jgi:GT2 family glycosyltransferase
MAQNSENTTQIIDPPLVSIVILNWKGWKDTLECLETLYRISYPRYCVIIVDNGSNDESIQKLHEYAEGKIQVNSNRINYTSRNKPIAVIEYSRQDSEGGSPRGNNLLGLPSDRRLVIIKNEKNDGFARGNNIGIRFALNIVQSDYVLILNNDTLVKDLHFLDVLVRVAEENPSLGAVNPAIRSLDGSFQRGCARNLPRFWDFIFVNSFIGQRLFKENRFWKAHFNYDYAFDRPKEFDVLYGSCILFRSQALQDVGLFDESTFLYWEEQIIGSKFKKTGWKSLVFPVVSIYHKEESTISNLELKSWARFWSIQSELYYIDNFSSINRLGKTLIASVLFFESLTALSNAIVKGGSSNFDKEYELKILNLLTSKTG